MRAPICPYFEADGHAVYRTELTKLRDHIDKELARLG